MTELYRIALWSVFGASVLVMALLLFVSAPYGRYVRKGWGPAIPARAAWIVMELPAVLVIAVVAVAATWGGGRGAGVPWGAALGGRGAGTAFGSRGVEAVRDAAGPAGGRSAIGIVPWLFLCLWQMHYIYRTFVFPLLMRGGDKRFPILLILFAMVFNTFNGYVNGYAIFLSGRVYPLSWLTDPRFVAGLLLFLAGFAVHVRADTSLRKLRSDGGGYKIPQGGLFEYVSAPNYFGEILQWSAWALLTWSLAGLSFAVFTIANLLPRALSHHAWYRSHFADYPSRRKAIIPFLV